MAKSIICNAIHVAHLGVHVVSIHTGICGTVQVTAGGSKAVRLVVPLLVSLVVARELHRCVRRNQRPDIISVTDRYSLTIESTNSYV